ncbi:MAG: alpha-D-ribose 1-methylphosphonate 5-triphosphate diphosphatase [Trichodesmium sp. St15_bin1_1]|jgi:alpha-D-ribose 1-methylphosphonate 5-triphosphate diphosphatase|nr:alpha-D-ribose 1-methylphosphonate 5-triphosphate diphosphatase [Trichodesmium sp. St16_bin2-tuft]MDE5112068.1 alpha-D-ribose 1-methylphosphonate 5-triphosphate diphosphatase [Trichodesmium sp. St7_bin2_1]MDE5115072.1 alpha-D-ribose 1-methylphosphonate 5-triphosphate diphosphatase [Trichodesmium sp. St15_bin1_1]
MKTYLTHCRLITTNAVIDDAAVLIEDGYIVAINPEFTNNVESISLNGQYLLPGLVDLHCDAIEKEIEPRPNAFFPMDFAIAQIDRNNAAVGITTPFHAISFAYEEFGLRNNEKAAQIVRSLHNYQPQALVNNRVHCRYEITDPTGLPILLNLLQSDDIHLISFMDHTPGQGQFKNVQAYQDYLARAYNKSATEVEAIALKKIDQGADALERVKTLISKALSLGVQVASHDDDSPERIASMQVLGIHLSEFPINLETAQAAKKAGLQTIFGAPNLLRGQSQSGSMKAIDAIKHQVGDILCADYSPASLLAAAFRIPELLGWSLPDAIALVTHNPAQAVNLSDRGEIATGKRADLIVVQCPHGFPQVTTTWVGGRIVYQCHYSR